MAIYRRELQKNELKFLKFKYKNLGKSEGGIFTADKRMKLLGQKPPFGKYHEDTVDFWYDVRSTVKNGLKDLELFFDVASPEQIKKILEIIRTKEENEILRKLDGNSFEQEAYSKSLPSLQGTLKALFKNYTKIKTLKTKGVKPTELVVDVDYDDAWKARLAFDTVKICLQFFRDHRFFSSLIHSRSADEIIDMLHSEIAVRSKLSISERPRGFA